MLLLGRELMSAIWAGASNRMGARRASIAPAHSPGPRPMAMARKAPLYRDILGMRLVSVKCRSGGGLQSVVVSATFATVGVS